MPPIVSWFRRGPIPIMLRLGSLVGCGVVAAMLWRSEVDGHGWHGLIWVSSFHWAVPAGLAIFIAWAALIRRMPPTRRWLLVGVLALLAVPLAIAFIRFLSFHYSSGPSLFLVYLSETPARFAVLRDLIQILWPVPPVVCILVATKFGRKPNLILACASLALFMISIPLTVMLSELLGLGHADEIHAFKTGRIIPFLFVALGLPFLGAENDARILPATI